MIDSIPAYTERLPNTIQCSYCGLWHECNTDGVIEGMCEAERQQKTSVNHCQVHGQLIDAWTKCHQCERDLDAARLIIRGALRRVFSTFNDESLVELAAHGKILARALSHIDGVGPTIGNDGKYVQPGDSTKDFDPLKTGETK